MVGKAPSSYANPVRIRALVWSILECPDDISWGELIEHAIIRSTGERLVPYGEEVRLLDRTFALPVIPTPANEPALPFA